MAHQARSVPDAYRDEAWDLWKERELVLALGTDAITVRLADGGEFSVPVLVGVDGRPGVDLDACLRRIESMLQGGEISELRARLCRGAVIGVAEEVGELVSELSLGDPRWTCSCGECESKRRVRAA